MDKNAQILEFAINQSMIDQFVQLTGDCSSLHTKASFARRSIYRTKLVHGMLPVVFISGLDIFRNHAPGALISQIVAKFLKPVFLGEALQLIAISKELDGEIRQTQVDYEIKRKSSGTVVTKGYFIVRHAMVEPLSSVDKGSVLTASAGMVLDNLTEENLPFEQITKGDQRHFRFAITDRSFDLLKKIVLNKSEPLESGLTNLLAASLCSTLAGVCLPGKFATFVDLALHFEHALAKDRIHVLNGTVGFKSSTTQVIVNEVAIAPLDEPKQNLAAGKMTVKVNSPFTKMLSMEALKKSAMGIDFKDKVVLVTGASRGIGETTAKLFALHGAKVAINYYQGQEDAQAIVEEIIRAGGEALAIQADVSDREQVKAMVSHICDRYGSIDVLVNNAVRDAQPAAFKELTWDDIQKDIDVTMKGAFNCCQEVLPLMVNKRQGRIINMGTIFIDRPVMNQSKYILSKSALMGLTRSLAVEYAPFNIQVDMIFPTVVDTDLSQGSPVLFSKTEKKIQPVDVARTIVLLASSQKPSMAGENVMMTGAL